MIHLSIIMSCGILNILMGNDERCHNKDRFQSAGHLLPSSNCDKFVANMFAASDTYSGYLQSSLCTPIIIPGMRIGHFCWLTRSQICSQLSGIIERDDQHKVW